MKQRILIAILVTALAPLASGRLSATEPNPMTSHHDSIQILDTSHDPKALAAAAFRLAASVDPADQQHLARALTSDALLSRLNAPEEYASTPERLRLRPILEALAKNAAARETLLRLTQSETFTREGGRVDLLIAASASIRPAPPQLVAFWNKHAQPDDGFTALTIRALIENGSAPALALFERKMADPAHEDEDKIAWMRSEVLSHRDAPELLRSCERLLKSGLVSRLRGELVEVLFDYRPEIWYVPAMSYQAPLWAGYSSEARTELHALGRYALDKLELTARQRAAVEHALQVTAQ